VWLSLYNDMEKRNSLKELEPFAGGTVVLRRRRSLRPGFRWPRPSRKSLI